MQNADISRKMATRLPYKDMLKTSLRKLADIGEHNFMTDTTMDTPSLLRLQVCGCGRVCGWVGGCVFVDVGGCGRG